MSYRQPSTYGGSAHAFITGDTKSETSMGYLKIYALMCDCTWPVI